MNPFEIVGQYLETEFFFVRSMEDYMNNIPGSDSHILFSFANNNHIQYNEQTGVLDIEFGESDQGKTQIVNNISDLIFSYLELAPSFPY